MSLRHIFGKMDARIWTKLGRGYVECGKSDPVKFLERSLQELQGTRQNTNLFRTGLVTCFNDFRETWQEYVNRCPHESFRSEILNISH